jgi:hypothetical protein
MSGIGKSMREKIKIKIRISEVPRRGGGMPEGELR